MANLQAVIRSPHLHKQSSECANDNIRGYPLLRQNPLYK